MLQNNKSHHSSLNPAGLFHLSVVYLVWGSTYLAIRVGVRPGAGFTPFMLGAYRVIAAGAILLILSLLTKQRTNLSKAELLWLFISGQLFWLGGNGLVMVGEQRADSGIAALIIAATPIWAATINALVTRTAPTWNLLVSWIIGTGGIIVLSMPTILSGVRADLLSIFALNLAAISWAGGTVLQSRYQSKLTPTVHSGYQLLFGGIGFLTLALIFREPLPQPVLEAWIAWAYLVIFGSLIAFTSYIQALRMLPTNLVTTYSYVNPIIAVILGRIILKETITIWTVAGAI
ncbi:MAG: EamA family transporter, partial [Anaerolineales bacterium]